MRIIYAVILVMLKLLIPSMILAQDATLNEDSVGAKSVWENVSSIFYSGQFEKKETSGSVDQPSQNDSPDVVVIDDEHIVGDPDGLASETPIPQIILKLQGIVIPSKNDKSAIINGELLNEGDFIDGYTVKAIRKNSVLLKRRKEEKVLYVKP